MRSAIPRCPTPTPTWFAIHGIRAAKLPVTHPCTANTAAVPRRARRTSRAGAARSAAELATAVTVRDYPALAENNPVRIVDRRADWSRRGDPHIRREWQRHHDGAALGDAADVSEPVGSPARAQGLLLNSHLVPSTLSLLTTKFTEPVRVRQRASRKD